MQLKSCIFTLFLFGVVSALGCGEDDHAKKSLQSSSPKTESHSEVATVKPLSQAELKSFEQVYAQRSSEKLPMTVGMLRSSMFSSYKRKYGFPLCNQPELIRLSRESAIAKLDAFEGRFGGSRSRSSMSARRTIERLKAIVRVQSDEYAPLLMQGAQFSATEQLSLKEPLSDLMYIPHAPDLKTRLMSSEFAGILKEMPSLAGWGSSIFLPSSIGKEPGLPEDVPEFCYYETGRSSLTDYCCSCDPNYDYDNDCSKYVSSCTQVQSCCGGSNAFWSDAFDSCGGLGGPIVDPRIWVNVTPITQIGK